MRIDLKLETPVDRTIRVRQVEALFDVPVQDKLTLEWQGELPIESENWNVGLIVGPSGSGKTQILKLLWGEPERFEWNAKSVVDDFPTTLSIGDITSACSSVGFNTIPAWCRSFSALSNGERFRVELARRILSPVDPILVDEFTSVVDRQVAQIGSYAVQKFVRAQGRRIVAASCHYDILEWLQPDWVLEPAGMKFTRRLLRHRPPVEVSIQRDDYKLWSLFAPFHYMSKELNHAAACFTLRIGGRPAVFCGTLHRPHPKVRNITGISRIVTLPDYQGLGLAFVLADTLGAAYSGVGRRFRNYPAHPSFIRGHTKSGKWSSVKEAGVFSPRRGDSSTVAGFGGRSSAVFEYIGSAMDKLEAERLLNG